MFCNFSKSSLQDWIPVAHSETHSFLHPLPISSLSLVIPWITSQRSLSSWICSQRLQTKSRSSNWKPSGLDVSAPWTAHSTLHCIKESFLPSLPALEWGGTVWRPDGQVNFFFLYWAFWPFSLCGWTRPYHPTLHRFGGWLRSCPLELLWQTPACLQRGIWPLPLHFAGLMTSLFLPGQGGGCLEGRGTLSRTGSKWGPGAKAEAAKRETLCFALCREEL